ncbi:MAG: 2,3-bisphosphoglycerate-independent phosphoglycerate mutase [Methylocystaceae bacterium]
MKQPVVLMILDGWGVRKEKAGNAILAANPINFRRLVAEYPYTELHASGLQVGLPDGQMGNSEVGHLNLGAGRVVYQEMTRISKAIAEGDFFRNSAFTEAIDHAVNAGKRIHLIGLLSDGGVHSLLEHLFALVKLSRDRGGKQVFIHAFTDGRDVPPSSAADYVHMVEKQLREIGLGKIATISGRYWGMDRDRHWERVERSYRAMVEGKGLRAPNAMAAVQASYEVRVTDEFIEPTVIIDETGQPIGDIQDGDTVICFNYRADRTRQLTRTLVDHEFEHFGRQIWPQVNYVCLTQYDATIDAPVAFLPQCLDNTLGEFLAAQRLNQLRIAETEKYAHVTFFFNGGVEEPNAGEDRILIPSPAVATYNLQPEMSANEVTSRLLNELEKDYYDVVILNYANPDMVGHTGLMGAAIKAVQAVDSCLQQVVEAVLKKKGTVLITADHGNAEVMGDSDEPHTAHTLDLVPFILVDERFKARKLQPGGSLQDVAPTLLEVMGIVPPADMTGHSLLI